MSNAKKPGLKGIAEDIDLRLGDILGQLGATLEEAADRLAQGQEGGDDSEIRSERTFDTGRGPIRASAGIRIRTLGGSTTRAAPARRPETPVNTPQGSPDPVKTPAKPRVQHVDATVFSEPGHWSLVADVPGISEGDISLEVNDTVLSVSAENDSRHYRIETDLPAPLGVDAFVCHVQNGILEITATEVA